MRNTMIMKLWMRIKETGYVVLSMVKLSMMTLSFLLENHSNENEG